MRFCSTVRCFAMLALAACASVLAAQSFDLDRDREAVVSLDGLWRFHPGDSPVAPESRPKGETTELWAQPGFDDSGWLLLRSDKSWSDQGYADMSGYGWYRFIVHVPAGPEPKSLMLAPIFTVVRCIRGWKAGGQVGRDASARHPQLPNATPSVYPLTRCGKRHEPRCAGRDPRVALAHVGELRGRRSSTGADIWRATAASWRSSKPTRR